MLFEAGEQERHLEKKKKGAIFYFFLSHSAAKGLFECNSTK